MRFQHSRNCIADDLSGMEPISLAGRSLTTHFRTISLLVHFFGHRQQSNRINAARSGGFSPGVWSSKDSVRL